MDDKKTDYYALAKVDPRFRTLKNGAIFDNDINRIVAPPPPGQNTFDDKQQARAAAQKRYDLRRAAVHNGMKAAGYGTEYGAISDMTRNLVEIAAQKQDLTAVRAFESVLKRGDFIPERVDPQSNEGLTINAGKQFLLDLYQFVKNNGTE